MLGISQVQVSRMEKKILESMRKNMQMWLLWQKPHYVLK
jgi:DNA-directed RNA polymerase specialized sigma subunit